jgi:uncharacterized protein
MALFSNRSRLGPQGLFAGRRAIVTGASSGIGFDVAATLASQGAIVAVLARRKRLLARLAEQIAKRGGTAITVVCDVTSPMQVTDSVQRVEAALGGIDILVNSAGILVPGRFQKSSLASFRQMMDVNFFGALHMIKAVLPTMQRAKSGNIVNIASIAGRRGSATLSGYSASKFALIGLTEALRAELFGSGVVASLVVPGSVDTPMLENPEWLSNSWFFGDLKMPPAWVTWGVIAAIILSLAEVEVPPGIVTAQKLAALFPDLTSAWLGLGFRTIELVNRRLKNRCEDAD